MPNAEEQNPIPDSVLRELSLYGLLPALLQQRIIREAVSSLEIDTSQIQQLRDQFCQGQQLENDQELEQYLRERAMDEGDLEWQLLLPGRIEVYQKREFGHKAEARFLQQKKDLDQVVYSLLRVGDGGLARELYLQISSGEANFADLAALYAEGPEQKTNGIIGPVPISTAHPALAEQLRINPPGQMLLPFAIDQWWLIVRVERYIPATFDQGMARLMAKQLFEQWLQEELAQKLKQAGEAQPALAPR